MKRALAAAAALLLALSAIPTTAADEPTVLLPGTYVLQAGAAYTFITEDATSAPTPVPPTPSPTVAPATPTPTVSPAATPSPAPTPTATPSTAPSPTPTPAPTATSTPPPPPSGALPALTRAYLDSLLRSGSAYDAMVSAANSSTRPNLADQNSAGNTNALARALLGRDTAADISAAKASLANVDRTLELARELAPLPLVSRLAGRDDAAFYRQAIDLGPIEGRDADTLRESAAIDPTNWGTMSRGALMAVAWYTDDPALIAEAWDDLRRYLEGGEGFRFKSDQVSWGAYTIGPKGYTKSGHDLDGMVHDIYRGGSFPTVGSSGVNYVWEATQGTIVAAIFADMAGHPEVWEVGDRAILRSVEWMYRYLGAPPSGDDRWVPWVVERVYGSAFSRSLTSPTTPGKNFGFTDWLYR